jgi:hypothetical protein
MSFGIGLGLPFRRAASGGSALSGYEGYIVSNFGDDLVYGFLIDPPHADGTTNRAPSHGSRAADFVWSTPNVAATEVPSIIPNSDGLAALQGGGGSGQYGGFPTSTTVSGGYSHWFWFQNPGAQISSGFAMWASNISQEGLSSSDSDVHFSLGAADLMQVRYSTPGGSSDTQAQVTLAGITTGTHFLGISVDGSGNLIALSYDGVDVSGSVAAGASSSLRRTGSLTFTSNPTIQGACATATVLSAADFAAIYSAGNS